MTASTPPWGKVLVPGAAQHELMRTQNRGRYSTDLGGPGAAVRRFVLHRIRDTSGSYCWKSEEGSTFTPGPMVEDTATRCTNVPFAPAGLAF